MLLLLFCSLIAQDPAKRQAFDACRQAFAEQAHVYQGADCFYRVGKAENRYDDAVEELGLLLAANPQLPWAHFYLGRIFQDTGVPEQAKLHYQQAVQGFQRQQDADGQVYSLINLARIHSDQGDFRAEVAHLEKAENIASDAGLTRLRVTVALDKMAALEREGQYELAVANLMQLETEIFATGSLASQIDWLLKMIGLKVVLGQPERAHQLAFRLQELAEEQTDPRTILVAGYAAFMIHEHFESWSNREQARAQAEQLLVSADTYQIAEISMQLRYFLGKLRGGEQGIALLREALATAEQLNQNERRAQFLVALATLHAQDQPEQAIALTRRAFDIWSELGSPSAVLDSVDDMNQLFASLDKPRSAFAWSVALLDYIEAVREWQTSDLGRAGYLSRWSPAYYLPAGRLLGRANPPKQQDVAAAFAVMERLRARSMREALAQSNRQLSVPAEQPIQLDQIFKLMDPALAEPQEQAIAQILQDLGQPRADAFAGMPQDQAWPVAQLSQVQAALQSNEAMLSYQLGMDQNIYGQAMGGAWLTVITKQKVRVIPIMPERNELAQAVSLYHDLLRDPQKAEWAARAGRQLYDVLLSEGIAQLSGQIEHLILIPDVALYRLPFEALTQADGQSRLGERYQLSQVPSATLWYQWRQSPIAKQPGSALVLANSGASRHALPDALAQARFRDLAPLTQAVLEGKTVLEQIGGSSTLYSEEDANEAVLNEVDLSQFGIVHFAAHAVVDESQPKMSAIVLAAKGNEDGYLFANEISEMELERKVIVLSTCQSASGYLLYGEGPLSLARAFMQAGSRAVIGTLWPIDDHDARRFFAVFYQQLANEKSLAEALQLARQAMAEASANPAGYAGIIVLGDGAWVPFEKRNRIPWLKIGIATVSVLIMLVLGLYLFARAQQKANQT